LAGLWAASLSLPGTCSSFSLQNIDWTDGSACLINPITHLPLKGFSMATGTVKWYNDQKGYGFIQPDDGGKDVFVHISAVERAGMRGLNEGQKISFELETDKRSGKQSAGNLQAT
jgi:cold shock protein